MNAVVATTDRRNKRNHSYLTSATGRDGCTRALAVRLQKRDLRSGVRGNYGVWPPTAGPRHADAAVHKRPGRLFPPAVRPGTQIF